MTIRWNRAAAADLARLHDFLAHEAPDVADRTVRELVQAPRRLLDFPRSGEKLEGFGPREARRIVVGRYELRYEARDRHVIVLRVWHQRERRDLSST